jgi:hypothetical protein
MERMKGSDKALRLGRTLTSAVFVCAAGFFSAAHAGAVPGPERAGVHAGACSDACDRKAGECLDECEAKFKDDKPRVECKMKCATERQRCDAACPAP